MIILDTKEVVLDEMTRVEQMKYEYEKELEYKDKVINEQDKVINLQNKIINQRKIILKLKKENEYLKGIKKKRMRNNSHPKFLNMSFQIINL